MDQWRPGQTSYPSPSSAMQAPPEKLAHVALLNPGGGKDALAAIYTHAGSATYGRMLSRLDMPAVGDELHHFGWNACGSCLCPQVPHPHMQRRFLVVPGMRSSRIHIIDTKPDPRNPRIVKILQPDGVMKKTGTCGRRR